MFGPNISQLLAKRQAAKERLGNKLLPDWDAAHEYAYKRAVALDAEDYETVKQLEFEAEREEVRQALESNWDVSIKNNGELKDRGKLLIKRNEQHGQGSSPSVINSYLMTFDSMKNGSIVDRPASVYAHDAHLAEAATRVLTPAAISELAKAGLRQGPAVLSPANRIGRAGDRTVEYGNGFDDESGAVFAGLPTDGGHGDLFPHDLYPEYSNARWNMHTELSYPNSSKGKRVGEPALIGLRKGIKTKMHADDTGEVIRSVAKGWQVGGGSGDEPVVLTSPPTMLQALQGLRNLEEGFRISP